ncbi:aspartate carbamoyltransferase catalytic subunit [Virgibacillus halophilus]|uniref:Aspartate carbamoyltransferase n=1 Tax=Tigheibacillus halophilus TaxID=361280 RepID=A0ABU5CAG5_9BACI|nr:aspartate carbamoyltransferase catalytic subunit [Virgibacillus halophilus]
MRHFESLHQFSVKEIMEMLDLANHFKRGGAPSFKDSYAANLFYEPSTRTKNSFMMAQHKLGMNVLEFDVDTSSVKKGETLYDTAKTMEAIGADLLIIRHPDDHWADGLRNGIGIPLINGGAGKVEHPTQGLLDLLTIYQEFGHFQDLKIAICGDIAHSRVAHSNAEVLQRMGAEVYMCAAPGFEDLSLPIPYITIDEAVNDCDVVMLLRIQHERHESHWQTSSYLEDYGLTKAREKQMKKQAIIMHPAPINRDVEIDTELVECQRSRIFKQMENGVYTRMAIITKMMEEWRISHATAFEEHEANSAHRAIASL